MDDLVFIVVHFTNSIPTVPSKGAGVHRGMLRGNNRQEVAVMMNNISMK
jgi:hypothetical protein